MDAFDCAGATIRYEVAGAGAPLITIHGGLGFDHSYFRPWLDPLAEHHTVVYFDQRANGRSTGDPGGVTLARLADDVDALRAHLGFDRVRLLGHSYGGFVALQHALAHPARTAGMVLCGTDSAPPSGAGARAGLARLGATAEDLEAFGAAVETQDDFRRWSSAVRRFYFPHSAATVAEQVLGDVRFRRPAREAGSRALAGWDVTAALAGITAPALVVTGRDDFLFPPERAEALAGHLPGAELLIAEGSGHLPFVEEQDLFLARVRAFLDGCG